MELILLRRKSLGSVFHARCSLRGKTIYDACCPLEDDWDVCRIDIAVSDAALHAQAALRAVGVDSQLVWIAQ